MFGIDSRLRVDYDTFENLRRIGLRVALPPFAAWLAAHIPASQGQYILAVSCVCVSCFPTYLSVSLKKFMRTSELVSAPNHFSPPPRFLASAHPFVQANGQCCTFSIYSSVTVCNSPPTLMVQEVCPILNCTLNINAVGVGSGNESALENASAENGGAGNGTSRKTRTEIDSFSEAVAFR